MRYSFRIIQVTMLATIALFFTMVAFNNFQDYSSNWMFVQHVLSMDTTFKDPAILWRAITNPALQRAVYYLIIAWEIMTAMVCWAGCVMLLKRIQSDPATFNQAKQTGYIGLLLGFVLYMVGFVIIASEWFAMWQSQSWNAQKIAILFTGLILFVLLILKESQ